MRLRWKYFIFLVVVSLVPMTAVTVISQRASKKLGTSISDQTQKVLLETIRREVVSATENYALITRRNKTSLEFGLQVLTKEATMALVLPVPDPTRIYFAKQFEDPGAAPADLTPSRTHMQILKDGRHLPQPVSYEHPNYLLAPGISLSEVDEGIARLTRLAPLLKSITGEFGDAIFRIYASLESGVHISYPGHGGYPADYDPRRRPWYLRARKSGALTWGDPIVDATTGQLTFTVSEPILKSDGTFAGVAAIDVLIPNVLLKSQISSQWSKSMKSFLVGRSEDIDSGKKELWVISQNQQVYKALDTAGSAPPGTYVREENKFFSDLIDRFEVRPSGSLELPFEGEDSLWAFATIFPDLHFVIVAPTSIIMGLPQAVGKSFASYSQGQTIITMTAVVIIILIVASIAFIVSQTTTTKIMRIVNGFRRLEQGDYSVRLAVEFKDERDLIVTTFNQIMPTLKEHLRMSRGLGVAKEVQQSLLPKANPALPGFDIAGTSLYCEETGGDYYDYINLDKDRLAVVVGDVSGHGVSSALLMATARALIMLRAAMPGSTAAIVNDVNRQLSLDTYDTGNFMTLFYCRLSAVNRSIQWVRAGHEPALLYDPVTDQFDELKGHGVAFGLDSDFNYEEFRRTLTSGQIILIGTDGIWEMRNTAGEMFGKQRLIETIRSNHSASAGELLASIINALAKFRGSQAPEDDVTMVVIKVKA